MSQWEGWIIVRDKNVVVGNLLEVSEDWAWVSALRLQHFPSQLDGYDRAVIKLRKDEGYRAVKVRIEEIKG